MIQLFNKLYHNIQSKLVILIGLISVYFVYKKTNWERSVCILIATMINAYLINHLANGNCSIMAWIYVILNILGTLVIISGLCKL
jgi:hypothetical protein